MIVNGKEYTRDTLTIMGLASGAALFGTGFAHEIIEEITKYYMDLKINSTIA